MIEPSAAILDLALNKIVLVITSPAVPVEYAIRANSSLVHPATPATAAKGDESDNRFLECAAASRANYLITGNAKHFPETFEQARIVTPRQFIDFIVSFLFGE